MIPYARQCEDITPVQYQTYLQVVDFVETLLDGLTCHDVAAAVVAKYHELKAHQGWFVRRGVTHSWVSFRDDPEVLIDVYPWASGSGPLLLTIKSVFNPWRELYVEAGQEEYLSLRMLSEEIGRLRDKLQEEVQQRSDLEDQNKRLRIKLDQVQRSLSDMTVQETRRI